VGYEGGAQGLRVGVDKVVELEEDHHPDVIGAQDKRVVLSIGEVNGIDEPIFLWDQVGYLSRQVAATSSRVRRYPMSK
jgi:hypothetical protein